MGGCYVFFVKNDVDGMMVHPRRPSSMGPQRLNDLIIFFNVLYSLSNNGSGVVRVEEHAIK